MFKIYHNDIYTSDCELVVLGVFKAQLPSKLLYYSQNSKHHGETREAEEQSKVAANRRQKVSNVIDQSLYALFDYQWLVWQW